VPASGSDTTPTGAFVGAAVGGTAVAGRTVMPAAGVWVCVAVAEGSRRFVDVLLAAGVPVSACDGVFVAVGVFVEV
jgi:hypothetical protein